MKNFLNKIFNADNTSKGFSLVELIVVIVILAILVGVTIGGVYQYVNQARVNTDISNAETIQSVLSTIATNEKVYKEVGKTTNVYKLQWISAQASVPEISAAADVDDEINKILTDGLPASQTGDGFELKIEGKGDGQTVITCSVCDPALTSEPTFAWN